MKCSVSS